MSGRLAMKVMDSGLDPRLKLLANTLALYATEEGDRIFPGVKRLARQLGHTERYVQKCLAKLRAQKILIADAERNKGGRFKGGGYQTVWYRFDETALPADPEVRSDPFLMSLNPVPQDTLNEPKNTRLSPPLNPVLQDTLSVPSDTLNPVLQDTPKTELRVSYSAVKGVLQDTRSVSDQPVSTNTSTAAFASVPPTTTERRRKTLDDKEPTFATVSVLASDVVSKAESNTSEPDLVEDIRTACAKTFHTYDTAKIRKALDALRHNEQMGIRRPSTLTKIADLMPPALGRR